MSFSIEDQGPQHLSPPPALVSFFTLFLHWRNLAYGNVGTEQLEMVQLCNGCVTLGESLALSELSSSPSPALCL